MEKHGALLAVKRVLDVSQSAHDPLKRRKMHEWQDAGAGQSGQPPPSVPIREIYDPVTSVSPPRDGLHASRMGDKHSGAAEMEKRVADYHVRARVEWQMGGRSAVRGAKRLAGFAENLELEPVLDVAEGDAADD